MIDGVAADAQAGTGDDARVDGVADGGVGGAGALGAHVALGGEAGHEVGLGGLLGEQSAPGNRLLDGLEVLGAGMEEQMHMGVDQAGKQRCVAEVDDPGALRMVDRAADGADAVALDENFAGLEEGSGVHLEQARGVKDDGRDGRLLGGSVGKNQGRSADGQK